jgi:hypothetical protein
LRCGAEQQFWLWWAEHFVDRGTIAELTISVSRKTKSPGMAIPGLFKFRTLFATFVTARSKADGRQSSRAVRASCNTDTLPGRMADRPGRLTATPRQLGRLHNLGPGNRRMPDGHRSNSLPGNSLGIRLDKRPVDSRWARRRRNWARNNHMPGRCNRRSRCHGHTKNHGSNSSHWRPTASAQPPPQAINSA